MRRRAGVSLVEMLVAVGVLAILLAIGEPWYRGWQARAALRNSANMLAADLRFARGNAIKLGETTVDLHAAGYAVRDSNGREVRIQTLQPTVSIANFGQMSPLIFAANGTANRDAAIEVRSDFLKTSMTVAITASTGQVLGP